VRAPPDGLIVGLAANRSVSMKRRRRTVGLLRARAVFVYLAVVGGLSFATMLSGFAADSESGSACCALLICGPPTALHLMLDSPQRSGFMVRLLVLLASLVYFGIVFCPLVGLQAAK